MKNLGKIEISAKTIVFSIFFILMLQLLWLVKDLLISIFIAVIVMSAVKPIVNFLEKWRIPRFISVLVIFFVIFGLLGVFLVRFLPVFFSELVFFSKSLARLTNYIDPNLSQFFDFSSLTAFLPQITSKFFDLLGSVFGNVVFVVSTIFFSFYFTLEENIIRRLMINFFSEEKTILVEEIFDQIENRLRAWFWGQIFLMLIIGVFTYLGLILLGVRQAFFLAVIAGLLEVVPNLGPVIATIPALIIGFSENTFLGVSVIALYFIIQQLENNLIVPLVMKKAVGINPIITLIALIVGGRLAGVMGILIAIPLTIVIETILIELVKIKK